jgi:cytochrome b
MQPPSHDRIANTPAPSSDSPLSRRLIRVWDLPTRLFHWVLALVIVALVVTGNVGGNAMEWHVRLGLLAGALVVFRLVWGVVGGRWSRFVHFVRGPVGVLRYLRGAHAPGAEVGHNPLGAWSVLALLSIIALQVATGLVADDEIATVGPLNALVSEEWAQWATGWHKGPGKTVMLILIGLHVAAIAFYRLRGQNLVRPMLTGDKDLPADTPASRDSVTTRLVAGALLLACVALAWWIEQLGN